MKLSREKMVHLSHVVVGALADADVKFRHVSNDVRLMIFDVLKDVMKIEEQIDVAVRRKISSQKRDIIEGSREWDLLFHKYYEDEGTKYRKVR